MYSAHRLALNKKKKKKSFVTLKTKEAPDKIRDAVSALIFV